jgi:hypothetical protein
MSCVDVLGISVGVKDSGNGWQAKGSSSAGRSPRS